MNDDPDSPEAWGEIEANELRLFIGDPITGLWCPTCLLPSGYKFGVQRDPAEPPTSWFYRCGNDKTHAVDEDAQP